MSEHQRNGAAEFLTVTEVASRLRVHHQTVRRWVRDETIPYVRAGRRVLFSWPEVRAWLQSRPAESDADSRTSGRVA